MCASAVKVGEIFGYQLLGNVELRGVEIGADVQKDLRETLAGGVQILPWVG
jgi:hypothetical protein